jgi:hypothetical protein
MREIERLFRRLRALLRMGTLEREMDEELRHHIEMEREELARSGLSPDEARRQALVAFGGVERTKEEGREARGLPWLEDLAQDVRYAARGLARTPGFAFAVIATLTLAIGANVAMFAVADAVLLSPLPYRDANRLVRLMRDTTKPWIAAVDAGRIYDPMARLLEDGGVPTFRTADRALRLFNLWAAAVAPVRQP